MGITDRTADTALDILLNLHKDETSELDENIKKILSDTLLTDLFKLAWRYQFEEDRTEVKRAIREMVNDAIDEAKLGAQK